MATLSRPVQWLIDFLSGSNAEGEKQLTADAALSYAPVWNSVNKICNNLGVMPLSLYRKTNDGKEIASTDDRHYVVYKEPNLLQTPIVFKSQITSHAVLWGNGRAYMHYVGRRLAELIPLMPDRPITVLIDGEKFHITKPTGGDRLLNFEDLSTEQGMRDLVVLRDSEVLHIPGFGYDGIEGLSLLKMAARSLNAGIASDKRFNTQATKGFSAKAMIEAPVGMFRDEADAKKFMKLFNEFHAGPENADKVGLLREGMKLQTMTMSNQEAEFIQQRQFQRQDAALWFMMESILGDGSTEVYNSISQRNTAYLTNCLSTWIVKWEEELNKKALSSREKINDSMFFKFDTSELRRGDYESVVKTTRDAFESTIISRNEARDLLDYNRVKGGDIFVNPNTMSGSDSPDDTNESNDTDNGDDTTTEEVDNAVEYSVILAHVSHLVGVEKNRLLQFAENPNKFLSMADKFYVKFPATMQNAVSKFTTDPDLGKRWCEASQKAITDLCDCQPEELKARLEEELASWETRINAFCNEVLNNA